MQQNGKTSELIAAEEHLFSESIARIADMHERMEKLEAQVAMIPEIKIMLGSIATAQEIMARSANSMAETFAKNENRIEEMEVRYNNLVKEAIDTARKQDQVPIKTHNLILLSAVVPVFLLSTVVVLFTLFYTKQEITGEINKVGKVTVAAVKQDAKDVEHAKEEKEEKEEKEAEDAE